MPFTSTPSATRTQNLSSRGNDFRFSEKGYRERTADVRDVISTKLLGKDKLGYLPNLSKFFIWILNTENVGVGPGESNLLLLLVCCSFVAAVGRAKWQSRFLAELKIISFRKKC